MDGSITSGSIVLLLDRYSVMERLLHESLQQVDGKILAVVLTEDNFLPKNVLSIYDLMIGNYRNDVIRENGRAKFFNELPVPDYWSFQVGDDETGRIVYQQVKKGEIHYVSTLKKRLVQDVEWYDRSGIVRFCDHYNRYGDICARTVYTATGEPASKTWLSPEGQEIVVENYVTHDIIVNDNKDIIFFRTKEELMLFILRKYKLHQRRIFINSLSLPLKLMFSLEAIKKEGDEGDVFFWQDTIGNDIPGNLRFIFDDGVRRCNKVIVQTRAAYNRLLELGIPVDKMQKLGFIYSYKKKNRHQSKALICTNTDSIEHCEELIQALPQMHFHIAAITWMSSALFALGQYENVSLYPGVKPLELEELFMKCDFYFDINHFGEMDSSLYNAFLYNQLIFAFNETVHNREYVADVHTYSTTEFEKMVLDVREIMADEEMLEKHLEMQHRWALAENIKTYLVALHMGDI